MSFVADSGSIVVRDLEGALDPWQIYSIKGSIIWESNLKPLRDRLYLTGFDAIKEPGKIILKNGFQAVYRDTWRRFKTESYFVRNIKGIERMYLRALRYEDWFLDQVYHKKFPLGKFKNFLKSILEDVPYSVVSSLADKEIEISPSRGSTRREILYQLSKELGFLWTLKKDYGIIFFTKDESPGELFNPTVEFYLSSMTRTPNGWLSSDTSRDVILPGTTLKFVQYQENEIRISRVLNKSYIPARDGIIYYNLIETGIKNVLYDDLKLSIDSESYTFNVEEEPVNWNVDVDILKRQENYMLKGDRGNFFGRKDFINIQPITGETVTNVDDLSPWATMDGFGMAFPRQTRQHVSVTIPVTPIKSVRVGDVLHGVWNKNGEAFHLKLPEGFLFYEIDNDLGNKLYSGIPDGSVIGDKTKAELVAEADKFRGSAWKIKGTSSVTISVGDTESQPATVPLPVNETYLSLLSGGQATIEVKGNDGFFGFNASNTDESLGGGGIVSLTAGTGIVDVVLNPGGQTNIILESDIVRVGSGVANDPVVRKSDLEALVQKFNSHTHPYVDTPVGASTTSPTTSTHTTTASNKVFTE